MKPRDMARELSIHAERRVAENFRRIAAMDALQPRPKVISQRKFAGPLPDLQVSRTPHK